MPDEFQRGVRGVQEGSGQEVLVRGRALACPRSGWGGGEWEGIEGKCDGGTVKQSKFVSLVVRSFQRAAVPCANRRLRDPVLLPSDKRPGVQKRARA